MDRGDLRDASISVGCHTLKFLFKFFPRRRLDAIHRLVIVKPASVGDVLLATPVIRVLRQALPDAHIAFAVASWARAMVADNPHLDEVLDLGRVGARNVSLADLRCAVSLLRHGEYDGALILDRSIIVSILPLLAGIPKRIGVDSGGRGFSLSKSVVCPARRHEATLYLDVVRAMGISTALARLEFFPKPADFETVAAILDANLGSAAQSSPLVALHLGGGANPGLALTAKRWPQERFTSLARLIRSELGATLILVGGSDDRESAQEFLKSLSDGVVDLVGKLTWPRLGAMLQQCRLLVSSDTGAAHLANAVGTPTVVIFGPTDPCQYGPFGEIGEAVALDLQCMPCFRHGRMPACPYDRRCLRDLEVNLVWSAVVRQWGNKKEVARPFPAVRR